MYALILAGGRGERLRPLTDTIPKPMVPVSGKPILWHQVQWLKRGGVTDVVFLAGYRWEAIEGFFGDGSAHGFSAHYSIEDTPLGRGGAIRKGMSIVPESERCVVVTNGDIITAENLSNVTGRFRSHQEANPAHQATIMVVPFVSPYGLVDLKGQDDVVEGFREKVELPYWTNAGIYAFSREIEERLPGLGDHETSTFPALASEGKLAALRSRLFWRSVDSFKDLREAEEYLKGL
jgi:NDP-sugar pyrophosphorylase family protein